MTPGPVRDDPAIDDAEILYRRVTPEQVKWERGVPLRAGKNAFMDSSDGSDCSLAIEGRLKEHGLSSISVLSGYEDRCGLVSFTAGDARACGYGVLYTPKQGEPAHGSLTGDKTDAQPRKRLAEKSKVVVPPPVK
jgi:hypothetical protein